MLGQNKKEKKVKIFVCVKQVPDTETKIKINADQTGIDGAAVKWIMNPYDEYAVEEAIRIRDGNPGSQAVVISVGPKQRVSETVRTALAMGIDEGIVINSVENLDSYTTAKALAEVIKGEGDVQLILAGKLAIDDNAASVGQMIGEFLGIPSATVISKISFSSEMVDVERDIEGGAKELIQMKTPAVLGANKGLNSPRYASLPGIMKAKKKTIKEVEFSSLGIANSEIKVRYSNFSLPNEKPPVKILSGDIGSQINQLVNSLRHEAKVI